MISLSPVKISSHASHYFLEQDNYYLADDGQKMSTWFGRGAQILKLEDQVEPESFKALLEGKMPDGTQVGLMKDGSIKHRPGFDITFSAPKSWSILSLVAGDRRLDTIFQDAVISTLTEIEKLCVEARIREKGEIQFYDTHNLIAGLFFHDTSRELDPQLHTHAVIMNETLCHDGKWRALASSMGVSNPEEIHGFRERMYAYQIYFSSIFRSELAKGAVDLGYTLEEVGKHGQFELKEVPLEVREYFSKRGQQIEKAVEKRGQDSAASKDIAALNTRKAKVAADRGELHAFWVQEMERLGFDPKMFVIPEQEEKNLGEEELLSTLIVDKRIDDAMSEAISQISRYNTRLTYSGILQKALQLSLGKASLKDLSASLNKAIEQGDLIVLEDNRSVFTTKALVEREKHLLQLSESIQDQVSWVEVNRLDQGQAISNMLKTLEASGKKVTVLTQNRVLLENQNISRESNNFWHKIKNHFKGNVSDTVTGYLFKQDNSSAGSEKDCVIVDRANMLSLSDATKLLELTQKNGSQLILLDYNSGQKNVGASHPLGILQLAGLKSQPLEKPAKTPIRVDLLEVEQDQNLAEGLIQHYQGLSQDEREKTQIVVLTQKEREALNPKIREVLRASGQLDLLTEKKVEVLKPIYLTDFEKAQAGNYSRNQILRTFGSTGISDWKVVKVLKEQNQVVVHSGIFKKTLDAKELGSMENLQILERSKIPLAVGDRVISTMALKRIGLKAGTPLTVTEVRDGCVRCFDGKKSFTLSNEVPLMHDYVRTLTSTTPAEHLLLFSARINQNILTELKELAQNKLTLVTHDSEKLKAQCELVQDKRLAVSHLIKSPQVLTREAILSIASDLETIARIHNKPLNLSAVESAVHYAVEKLSEFNAGFMHQDLMVIALQRSMGKVNKAEIFEQIHQMRERGELVSGNNHQLWTTPQAVELEKKLLHTISAGKGRVDPLVSNVQFEENEKLKQDQKNACHLILTTQDRFVGVQGYAGTGKSTMLKTVKALLDQERPEIKILGVAPTHQAVLELKQLGIEAQTLKSFLINASNSDLSKTLLVLDEASMVSNKDYAALVQRVSDNHSRLVSMGDKDQHAAIEAGSPFSLIQEKGVMTFAILNQIIRQKTPQVLSAVKSVISKNPKKAMESLESLSPQGLIIRDQSQKNIFLNQNAFLKSLEQSVIEIKDIPGQEESFKAQYGGSKDPEIGLIDHVARDYLSRAKQIRERTVVIAHANEDRVAVNHAIRSGLKILGEIENVGMKTQRLQRMPLPQADLRDVRSYYPNQILKFNDGYWTVQTIEAEIIRLTDSAGNQKIFAPKQHHGALPTIYQKVQMELTKGDQVRLTHSDKARGFIANTRWMVEKIETNERNEGGFITLKSLKEEDASILVLDSKRLNDQHFDYAYSVTGYGVQGATHEYVIDLQNSNRKNLTNIKSFYISISRAVQHVMIYTDDKVKLLSAMQRSFGLKMTSHDAISDSKIIKNMNRIQSPKSTEQKYPEKVPVKIKDEFQGSILLIDIYKGLENEAEKIVEGLLGEKNQKLSTHDTWRYGNKGSLSITMSGERRGQWYSFEEGKGGHLIQLIQHELGLDFNGAVEYAERSLGSQVIDFKEKAIKTKPVVENQAMSSKSIIYAKQLALEAKSIKGTIAEAYLKTHRGIDTTISEDLKFHPNVSTGDKKIKFAPALLAIAKNAKGEVTAVQVTYLDHATHNKADLEIKKRSYGLLKGSVVNLSPKIGESQVSIISEGNETGLSAYLAMPDAHHVVTLGKSNIQNIPPEILNRRVVLCLDNDGDQTFKKNSLIPAIQKLQRAGKEVSIAMPTIVKMDANDILKQQGTEEVKVFLNKAVKVEHVENLDVKLAEQKLNQQFSIQGPRQIPQQQRDQKIR